MPIDERDQGDQFKFDPDRNPLEATDEPEAKAAEYGIYGYVDHAGEAFEGEPTAPEEEIVAPTPPPPGIDRGDGGKDWDDIRWTLLSRQARDEF